MFLSRRRAIVLLFLLLIVAPIFASERDRGPDPDKPRNPQPVPVSGTPPEECLQFGCDSLPSDVSPDNVGNLKEAWRITLPDVADGAPIYVADVRTDRGQRDLLIVSTFNGRVIAVDAKNGNIIWMTVAPDGPRWTTSSPAVDPSRELVYTYGLDGYVHRYSIHDGSEIIGDGWPELVTLKGDVEKGSSALSVVTTKSGKSYLYATIAAYPEPGDDGDYQGHVVTIDLATGEQHVFNALCSNRPQHFDASGDASRDCDEQQAGIWARAGVVYDPLTDRTFVTTGNGTFDADTGGFNWGSSVVAIHPDGTTDDGTPIDSYTPLDYAFITDEDLDLSSTTVAILPVETIENVGRLAVQGGKDERLRLLDLNNLSGQGGPRHLGGELQIVEIDTRGEVLSRPATWLAPDGTTWVFVTTDQGIDAYSLDIENGVPSLVFRWSQEEPGSSPIVDSGVLFYTEDQNVRALDPETGNELWSDDSIGHIHWESPIFVNDTLYLTDQDQELIAFRLPK
jgi:outer membrane protein assembly factor BamB